MKLIPLEILANQSFSVVLDQNRYILHIRETNGVMSVTVERNGVVIIQNMRAVVNRFIIPFKYLEDGNFFFITEQNDIPDFNQFGITQFLYYASQSEIDASRSEDGLYFDPNGSLPLRYDVEQTNYSPLFLAWDNGLLFGLDPVEENVVLIGGNA